MPIEEKEYSGTRMWIDRLIAGDGDAWRDFLRRIGPLVCSICRRAGLSGDETEDVAQSLVLKLLDHNRRLLRKINIGSEESFFAWIKVVVSRTIVDEKRDDRVRRGHEVEWAEDRYGEIFSSPIDDPIEIRVTLESAVDRLAPEERTLFELERSGLMDKEIARLLGLQLEAVQQRQSRMRKRLKEILEGKKRRAKT